MAQMMQFDLVSPEQALASVSAHTVQIPGADGDMTAMAGHTPTITTLRPGILIAHGPEGDLEYVVTGGFAEISGTAISVLAEQAVLRSDITNEQIQSFVSEAKEAHEQAMENSGADGRADQTARLVADMQALGTAVGINT